MKPIKEVLLNCQSCADFKLVISLISVMDKKTLFTLTCQTCGLLQYIEIPGEFDIPTKTTIKSKPETNGNYFT